VSVFTDENDVVVDPICRSGSSLVAAELNEREWIGADPILDNCKVARSRVWTAEMEELRRIGYWVDGKIEYIEG
jgi:DNA modification methylase